MARGQVATKIHRLQELNNDLRAIHKYGNADDKWHDPSAFFDVPAHYVVSPSLQELMSRSDAVKSIQAVHEAGIVALPYDIMLVEFETINGFREFVLLQQVGEVIEARYAFWLRHEGTDSYASLIGEGYGVPPGSEFGIVLPELIEVTVTSEGYLTVMRSPNEVSAEFRKSLTRALTFAMNVCFLCLNMQGVDKEVIQCGKLNKQRVAKGKPRIPTHTSLYIGRVWKRDGTSEAYDGHRRTVRVHMRAAHTRTQRIGKGRTDSKLVLIPACLVNYKPGDELPEAPKRIIRA